MFKNKTNHYLLSFLISTILIVFCTTACHPTPKESLVKNKKEDTYMDILDENRELKEVNDSDVHNTVSIINKFEGYLELWNDTVQAKSKNIKVNINASIVTPETDKLPVYEISLDKFTQEQIDNFLGMYGDVKYKSSMQIKTKEFYENEILKMKEYLEVELPKKDIDEEKRALLKEEYEEGIKNYTKKYNDAPETVNDVIKPIFTNQYIIQYSEQDSSGNSDEDTESKEKRKSAREYYEEQNTEVIDVNWEFNGETLCLTVGRSDNPIYNGLSFYRINNDETQNESYPIVESISDIEGLTTTYEEAKGVAENTIIKKLGIKYFTITHSAREEGSCYVFFFTRNIEGVNVTYCANNQRYYDRYDEPWNDEKLYVQVDDKGLKRIWMQSSLTKLGVEIADDAKLLPFDKIQEISKQQFEIGNIDFDQMVSGVMDNELTKIDLNIDEIVLGYARVKRSDNSGKYVMIPVWDFFGDYEMSGKSSDRCGELWRPQTITKMLKNKTYIGCMDQKKHTTLDYKNRKKIYLKEGERIFVENTHQAIIDKSTFEKVQSIFARCTRTPPYEKRVYLFSGFLRCADCRHAMIRSSSITKGKEACASHIIGEDVLLEVILTTIQAQINSVINAESVIKKTQQEIVKAKEKLFYRNKIKHIEDELKKVATLKRGLYEDYKKGIITLDEYNIMKSEYEKAYLKKQNELNVQKKYLEKIKERENSGNKCIENFKKHKNITDLSREVILSLIDEIIVFGDKRIKILFKFRDEYKKMMSIIDT